MEKRFLIKCKCGWSETSTGISSDLKHLTEIPSNCKHCGSARTFICLKCKGKAKMMRIGARRG